MRRGEVLIVVTRVTHLILSLLATVVAAAALANEEALPDIEQILSDPRRALVLEIFVEADVANLVDSYVSSTPPAGYRGAPSQLRLRWFDGAGIRIGTRNAWNPRWVYERSAEGEQRKLLSGATGTFLVPFDKDIERVALTDVESGITLLEMNVTNTVQGFCLANPGDPNCAGIVIPDADSDGVPDDADNCPDDANADQTDTDNDGIGDVCDPTPGGDPVPGDINGDRIIDDKDFDALRASLGKCEGDADYLPAADLTLDGCVAYDDYQLWYQTYFTEEPAAPAGC